MRTAPWLGAAVLSGTAGSALAAHGYRGAIMSIWQIMALFLLCMPVVFILSRRQLSVRIRLWWLGALLAIDLASGALLALANHAGKLGDELMGPMPWLLLVFPGYMFLALYQVKPAAQPGDNKPWL